MLRNVSLRQQVLVLAALAVLRSAEAEARQTKAPVPATASRVTVETVANGFVHPWGLQFLPDGRMLVTERPGRLRIVSRDGRLSTPIAGVPGVLAQGQGGLLDVALASDFAASRTIFLSYAEPRSDGNGTAVARARLTETGDGGRLDEPRVIFRQLPSGGGGLHFGSRIAIARDGNLFVTLGDRYHGRDYAQAAGRHWGKVVRITPDGAAPADNPFTGRAGARAEVWSLGHRNPQSAAIHPVTGKLWTVEHGAQGGDEVNIPEAGKNYGWPVITYGRDYSGARIGEGTAKLGMEQPVYYWDPSIAPSGMAFYTADLAPQWKGNLFVGALAGRHLARLVIDGEMVVGEEKLLVDVGERIRDVRQGPDGALYVLTDSPEGRVLRVAPRS